MASNILLPTEPATAFVTLERLACTILCRHPPLGGATCAAMPFQVLRSTELLPTPITGYLQGIPFLCRHPASPGEMFDRCSGQFISAPFTSTDLPQPLRLLRQCLPSLVPRLCLRFLPCGWFNQLDPRPPILTLPHPVLCFAKLFQVLPCLLRPCLPLSALFSLTFPHPPVHGLWLSLRAHSLYVA